MTLVLSDDVVRSVVHGEGCVRRVSSENVVQYSEVTNFGWTPKDDITLLVNERDGTWMFRTTLDEGCGGVEWRGSGEINLLGRYGITRKTRCFRGSS